MRGRILATACSVFAGLMSVSTVSAAPSVAGIAPSRLAPAASSAPDHSNQFVNFALGSVAIPSLGRDGTSFSSIARVTNPGQGLQLEMGRGRNWDIYGDLFPGASALRSSYLLGSSNFAGMKLALGDSLSLAMGHDGLALGALDPNQPSVFSRDLASRLGTDLRSIGTTSARLDWNFADWGALGLNASRSTGNGSLLGVASGAMAASPTESSALGISARVGFGEGWVTTVAYNDGVTQLDLNRALVPKGDALHSQGYGIALAKQGLFGGDALGIAVSRPLEVYAGLNPATPNFALVNSPVRESDVELGYVTTFLDGTLALQANAAYQLNAAGAKGQNAVAGVARAKLNF